ncbi:MAG: hypothetical protein HY874_00230 [Chloroflexi bacterium]|nr:hypothetical protein [Chloroflexota bacterium]
MALLIVCASALGLAWALASVRTASAEITGPCGATLNGVDIASVNSGSRSDDIAVSEHGRVPVVMTSATGFRSHKIQLEFAGRRWTVSNQQDDGSKTFSDSVNVDDYATYGVGLYKVVGVATLTDGTKCSGAATVDVGGNPLATVAGAVAVATVAAGTVGAVATGAGSLGALGGLEDVVKNAFREDQLRREKEATAEADRRTADIIIDALEGNPMRLLGCLGTLAMMVLMLPFMAISGGGGGAGDVPAAKALPRVRWTPHITLLGLFSGLLAGVGGTVLLQQYSIDYPTLAAIIRNVVVGVAVYGLVIPTLGYTLAVRRLNGRIARYERTLAG